MERVRRWLLELFAPQFQRIRDDLAAIHKTEADRKARKVIAIEFSQSVVDQLRDWSAPVQLRFVQTDDGEWVIAIRNASQHLHEEAVAERAARQ